MYSTRVSRHVAAPRSAVYRALLDPQAVAAWRVPDGMRSEVHEFDARPGGRFRVSLTYDDPGRAGKSTDATDTYRGHFAELDPDRRVVEVIEFESDDAGLRTPMRLTTTLADAGAGTEVTIEHDGIPDAVPRADNEAGTRMALAGLARYVEAG